MRVGHQVLPQDLGHVEEPSRDRGLHIGFLARREHDRTHQPHHARHLGNGDRDQNGPDARPPKRHDGNRQKDVGNGHEPVHHPHQNRVEPPDIPRQEAQHQTGRNREHRRAQPHDKRNAPAVDDARKEIAAVGIGAQPVKFARRFQALCGRQPHRVMRHHPWREQRRQHDDRQDQRGDEHERAREHDLAHTIQR